MKLLFLGSKRILLFYLLFLLAVSAAHAQDILDSTFQQPTPDQALTEFLSSVEQKSTIRFYYLDEWLEPFRMTESADRVSLRTTLGTLLEGSGVDFVVLYNYAVVFLKDPAHSQQRDALIKKATAERKKIDRVTVGNKNAYQPGKRVTIQGVVTDEDNKSPLAGVTIYVHELNRGLATDAAGKFNLVLPAGEYLFTLRSVNYEEKVLNVMAYGNGELKVQMIIEPTLLEEIVISDQNILNTGIGQSKLKLTELQRAPSFLGEADVIKQIQMQSGVTTASEAAQGFNVRGGSTDQNLVLFDGTPIFNTSHALGFFTAFNSDALQESAFYKGSVPAEFGGRTSSVLNITSKEGDFNKWHGKGGLGLVSSELVLDGPIKKDTSALAFSVRSSYSDWILNQLETRYRGISQGSIFFYDANIKYAHKFNKHSKLTVSGYTSMDRFSIANDTVNQWQNIAATVRYDKTVNDAWFYTAALHWGQYGYEVSEDDPVQAFNLNFGVIYPSLKIDVNRNGILHKQSFGFHSTYYQFKPGTIAPTAEESQIRPSSIPRENAIESALYFNDSYNWRSNVQIEAGLRLSIYNRLGAGNVYHYQPDLPREPEYTTDTTSYSAGQFIKTYIRPEPRLAANITLDLQSALKIGYNRMHQYVHLITNSATITPVDIWQASNTYFKPVRSDQFSVGYFRNSKSNVYDFSLEVYYKMQANILEFKDGANLILNPQLETALLNGKARAYGVELTVNKLKGRLVGGFNYAYARSKRKVEGPFDIETVNNGSWYPSNFDQPHVFNANWRYNITRRIFFTGTFTYHTGRPVSIPVAAYSTDGNMIMDFTSRNNYRLDDYHRMDVAVVMEGSRKKNRKFEGVWVVSIYNVYGRKNPYSVFFVSQSGVQLKPYQLSLIGTAVPSLTYQFKF